MARARDLRVALDKAGQSASDTELWLHARLGDDLIAAAEDIVLLEQASVSKFKDEQDIVRRCLHCRSWT